MRLCSQRSFVLVRSCVVFGRSPEAARAPTSRRTRAVTAILQQHEVLPTFHRHRGADCSGWEDCCYEAAPREFSGRAPPLRIYDPIVLVTTSYGSVWVLQRITCGGKQVWCSVSFSSSPLDSLENNFHTPHPEWLLIFTCWCFAFICLFSINLSSHLNVPNGPNNDDLPQFMFLLLVWVISKCIMPVIDLKT